MSESVDVMESSSCSAATAAMQQQNFFYESVSDTLFLNLSPGHQPTRD